MTRCMKVVLPDPAMPMHTIATGDADDEAEVAGGETEAPAGAAAGVFELDMVFCCSDRAVFEFQRNAVERKADVQLESEWGEVGVADSERRGRKWSSVCSRTAMRRPGAVRVQKVRRGGCDVFMQGA